MYADRYSSKPLDPGSLALSMSIVGGLVAAAMLSNTVIAIVKRDPGIHIYTVPTPPPPPRPEPQPQRQAMTHSEPRIDRLPPIVESRIDDVHITPSDPGPVASVNFGDGGGVVVEPPKPPAPMLRGADVDGHYARDFQPVYPAEERRAGREGVVTLKVLIGTDGRVRQVERLVAASDAFWRVTQERALAKWRFRPATRDGVPYETWKTMTVRFRLEEE